MSTPEYFRLTEGDALPDLAEYAPFRAVLVIDGAYTPEWQALVSDWLVRSGCLYMMAWGPECSSWDDSVDWSNIEAFGLNDIPDEFVITTWHEDEPLEEVFWFSEFCARHPHVQIAHSLVIHIGSNDRRLELLSRYSAAQSAFED